MSGVFPGSDLNGAKIRCVGRRQDQAFNNDQAVPNRRLFKSIGKKVFIGRNVTFRHSRKTTLGSHVILDDNCVIDAKGESNRGISIGDGVYIGRNTILYCKNGDMEIGPKVNISANCIVMSSNQLSIGEGTTIGALCHFLSGGEYDYKDQTPFCEQRAVGTRGPLTIGRNCWIGTGVKVLDAACIGDHCVIGAGSVVTKPIPPNSLAVGVPARVIRSI